MSNMFTRSAAQEDVLIVRSRQLADDGNSPVTVVSLT